ncbi:type 4a pilus biogenesis protein PilO [Patescibacteria group bacterium]|nr:type 4a pilus biogenesis protein PilO [Patescibacteria group bacterium]MBU2263534.1 type 4a pilus biogenesis protein PilO [Patescibacteria group bacterium]
MFRSILSIIFIAAAIVIFFTWTQPYIKEIKDLRSQNNIINENLANLKELQSMRDEILSKYNSISQLDLDRLNKILPSQANAIELIIEIENIAKSVGMSLKNIDVSVPEEKQEVSSTDKAKIANIIPVTIRVTGPYSSFIAIMENLEKNLRLVDIEKITFLSGDTDLYEYNITALAYWKK